MLLSVWQFVKVAIENYTTQPSRFFVTKRLKLFTQQNPFNARHSRLLPSQSLYSNRRGWKISNKYHAEVISTVYLEGGKRRRVAILNTMVNVVP